MGKAVPIRDDSVSLKIGSWFEARASGRGLYVLPVILVVVGAAFLGWLAMGV